MKTHLHKAFSKSWHRLTRGDAAAKLAYQKVAGALQVWEHDDKTYLQVTHHGESRIPHCVKYDLGNGYRLVTVEHEGQRHLLFVGTHDETDRWVDNHVGVKPTMNARGRVTLVIQNTVADAMQTARDQPLQAFDTATGTVWDGIPEAARHSLKLPPTVVTALALIKLTDLGDQPELWDFIISQPFHSTDQAFAAVDVLTHVGKGEIDEAITRAELYAGLASSSPENVAAAIAAGNSTDTVIDAAAIADDELRKILESHAYSDWLLYLNPAQKKHVVAHHTGPARVLGVSGSGKTCVAVHRAKEMATRYPGERILLLVLNESLKTLVHRLLDELCPDHLRRHIRVQRIYEYCRDVVDRFSDVSRMRLMDDKTGETVEICWDQYTRRPHRAVYKRLLKNLEYKKVDPWGYLHDELIWIRSGIGDSPEARLEYLTLTRDGRGNSVNLPKAKPENAALRWIWGSPDLTTTGFHSDTRHQVLQMLTEYEDYMRAGALLDEDGMALKAHALRDRIQEEPDLRARCVIVDECQDCSTVQLAVVARIPTAEKDGLLLVGDPAQKVFPKQQHLPTAGIDILGRSTVFRENYRNTREILEAAFPIVDQHRKAPGIGESDILPPEYARRHGPRPTLIRCKDDDEQRQVLKHLLHQLRSVPDPAICIGFPAATERMSRKHYSAFRGRYSEKTGTDVLSKRRARAAGVLPPETLPIDINTFGDSVTSHNGRVVIAEFDEMKGFEFSTVVLVNLDDASLYPKWVPTDEYWRIAFQTYVAMTRARDSLWLLTASEEASILDCSAGLLDSTTGEHFLSQVRQDGSR
jgi:superfamily I DNA/RNA helicase